MAARDGAAANGQIAFDGAFELAESLFGFVSQCNQPQGIVIEKLAFFGGDSLFGQSIDQPAAKMMFQVLYVAADGRLRQVDQFSGL
jgi:hypothetical protein